MRISRRFSSVFEFGLPPKDAVCWMLVGLCTVSVVSRLCAGIHFAQTGLLPFTPLNARTQMWEQLLSENKH
jgi:hypothetical protein